MLTEADRLLLTMYVGEDRAYCPDFTISPTGEPYLYRWYIAPRNQFGNCYLHIQVASDEDRFLHCHPWKNMSVILSGGYEEVIGDHDGREFSRQGRKAGDVVYRQAKQTHRLIMPEWNKQGYTMTLFTTGPKVREWGFWVDGEWRHWKTVVENRDGESSLTQRDETS
jgi:hypothetical protein